MTPEDPGWPRASDWLGARRPRRGGAPLLVVLGAPLSQASISPSGAHETPRAVRAALRRYSTFCATARVDLEDVDVVDAGDLQLHGLANDLAQERVARSMGPITADLVVLLGGDNSITRPAVQGRGTPLARMGLLTLDAHHDVRGFHAGATNGTPVRGLISDGMPGEQIAQVGIGAFTNSRGGWVAGYATHTSRIQHRSSPLVRGVGGEVGAVGRSTRRDATPREDRSSQLTGLRPVSPGRGLCPRSCPRYG
ncbi:MAG: arginase family protein [Egibacteraceae bacterium]